MYYFETLSATGSEYTYKLIIGHGRVGVLIIIGLGWSLSRVRPMTIFGVGLRLLRAWTHCCYTRYDILYINYIISYKYIIIINCINT